jgi:hypothetical protein
MRQVQTRRGLPVLLRGAVDISLQATPAHICGEWDHATDLYLLAAGLRCYRGGMAEVDGRGTDRNATI